MLSPMPIALAASVALTAVLAARVDVVAVAPPPPGEPTVAIARVRGRDCDPWRLAVQRTIAERRVHDYEFASEYSRDGGHVVLTVYRVESLAPRRVSGELLDAQLDLARHNAIEQWCRSSDRVRAEPRADDPLPGDS